jgi:uncharacterized repeat protein (TIGR01451 family)
MKTKLLTGSIVTGVAAAILVATPAFAWHPKGVIVKTVQDVTTNSAVVDANDDASALGVHIGDTLIYTLTVSNNGSADSNGYNDMANVNLSDKLPTGVVSTEDATTREYGYFSSLLKPGEKLTKTITVKVVGGKGGNLIENQACFSGDSTVNDNPQAGCDVAIVKIVDVPVQPPVTPPVTPVTPVTPPATPKVEAAKTLVNTGSASAVPTAMAVSALGYVGALMVQKKRANKLS